MITFRLEISKRIDGYYYTISVLSISKLLPVVFISSYPGPKLRSILLYNISCDQIKNIFFKNYKKNCTANRRLLIVQNIDYSCQRRSVVIDYQTSQ